jgi:hypothetical protein
MAQTIRLKRGAGAPAVSDLVNAEPAWDTTNNNLNIGTGTAVIRLVGNDRQVELAGVQTITGRKNMALWDGSTGALSISGGNNGEFLQTNGSGELEWAEVDLSAGAVAVVVEDPIDGDGTTGDPLTVTPATTAQIGTGTDNVFPLTSAGLRSQLGSNVTALTTTAQTVVPAINELAEQIDVLNAAIRFVGLVNATTGVVTPVQDSPLAAGPLPAAAAANTGYMVIATVAGAGGTGNLPAGPIAVADLLISSGSAWVLVPLNLGTIAAANVLLTAISGITATNVQDAVSELYTAIGDITDALHFDGTSIVGDGSSSDPYAVGEVDGGTY